MAEVSRDLWWPSGLTYPAQAGSSTASCPRPCPFGFWMHSGMETSQPLWHPVPVLCYLHTEKFSWCSDGTSCVPVCTHCLLPSHWAPLRRAWPCLLCILPSGICGHPCNAPSLLFCRLSSPSSLCLSSQERCPSPLNILVALHCTLSGVSMSPSVLGHITVHSTPGLVSPMPSRGKIWSEGNPVYSLPTSVEAFSLPHDVEHIQLFHLTE